MHWQRRGPTSEDLQRDHGNSRNAAAVSSTPKRSGRDATTSERVATAVFFCASMLFILTSAWWLSQAWATNTASSPKTAATAIMMMVLERTVFPISLGQALATGS